MSPALIDRILSQIDWGKLGRERSDHVRSKRVAIRSRSRRYERSGGGEKMRHRVMLAVIAAALATAAPARAADAPGKLTMGDRARPLNVEGTPRFGWMPGSAVQTAYELKLTKDGADVWDSGKVASSAQSYVPYDGPALQNGAGYDWTVRTWDGDGAPSQYAAIAHFDTGLTDSGWSGAQWIRRVTSGADSTDDYTLARKRFDVAAGVGGEVVRARVYVSA